MEQPKGLEYDLLTGLHSRWYARIALQKVLEAKEYRVFCAIDLDGFGAINKQYGEEVGDSLLKAIAEVIRTAYKGELVFHFSGDEFCVLINPESYSRYQMSVMTRHLFNQLHKIKVKELEGTTLSFSIGSVFVDPNYYRTLDDVYRQATFNRLEAKKHEGNYLYSRYGSIPDIEGAFLILREDRARYNNLSSRLFSIHNQADWMEYMNEGAKLKEHMFQRNQGHLNDILLYYENEGLPDEDYDMLFRLVLDYADSIDAFMFLKFIDDILLPHYERIGKESAVNRSRLGQLYLLAADNLISVMRMGDHKQKYRIKELLCKVLEVCKDLPHNSLEFEPYYLALCEILGHFECIDMQIFNREECDHYFEELRKLTLGDIPYKVKDERAILYFESLIKNARLFPLYRTSLLLLKPQSKSPAELKEIEERIIYLREHLSNDVFDMVAGDPEYSTLAKFLQELVLVKVPHNEVLRRLEIALTTIHQLEYRRISDSNLIVVAYLFLASATSIIKADIPDEMKLSASRKSLDFIINLLRKREAKTTDHQLLFIIQVMLRSVMDSPYLPPTDKVYYLEKAMATITLDTYSHSKAVASYAKVILNNIIDNYPGLLVGSDRPYSSVDDVKANKASLLEFMDDACMLHDIGKMTIVPITSNSYRRLTDEEFSLIRNHPANGCRILRLDPAFEPFIPFARNHHRWWDREGGYPKPECRETPTKYKVLVDILTICDTLEAATSRIGRNYRNAKTFLQIFDELYIENGTRYSKEILQTIISSVDTYYNLRQMIDIKWQDNYQAIFQEVVNDSMYSAPEKRRQALPNIYENKCATANDEEILLGQKLAIPVWLKQMNHDTLMLYAFSLMENNRISVMHNRSIIFCYHVSNDMISFLYPDKDGQPCHMMAQHYSEKPIGIYFSNEGYQKAIAILKRVIHEPDYPKEGQVTIESSDSNQCQLVSYTSVEDKLGHVLTVIGQVEDINTNRKTLLRSIDRQNQHIHMLSSLTQMFEIVVYTDIKLENLSILKASSTVTHDTVSLTNTKQFIDYTLKQLVHPDYIETFNAFIDIPSLPERLKGKPFISLEYLSKLSGWLFARIIPAAYDKKGNLTHIIFAAEGAEAEHQKRASLTHAATYDGLTGLLNRTKGEEIIRQKIAQGGPQIFAILDCDHFKRINDHLSHLVGDEVLREQSRIMKKVFKGFQIMRLGGDEFVVYLNGEEAHRLIYSINGIQDIFYKFAESINSIHIPELENVVPTMSCGVVYCNDNTSTTFEMLYEHADHSLHISKEHRNGAITFNEVSYNEFHR